LIDLYYLFFDREKERGRGRGRWRVWLMLENGGGEERTMVRLTKKKIWIQSILKKDWSKTGDISKFFGRLSIYFGGH
jgi:hypothetical protein